MAKLHAIEGLDKHAKSFLRCIETLLEIRSSQHDSFLPPPPLEPGEERYLYTMTKYPSLKKYIPVDIFHTKGSLHDLEKKVRRVYPYTDTLIEDITVIRKEPDPCSLFYKGTLLQIKSLNKVRKACKKLVDTIPRCEEILKEVLDTLSNAGEVKELTFKEITLPKGFSELAEGLRNIKGLQNKPSYPITIHEHSPKEYEKVLGDRPFLLLGNGNMLHGIKDYEIDVSDDIDEIRKGEITMGSIMFLYLFIKCDSHIDV